MSTLSNINAAFAGDDGAADPAVRQALAAVIPGDRDSYLDAVVALCAARLLIPIVATGDDGGDGPDPDRHAEMAAVTIEGPDGKRALLAFTGSDAMLTWEPRARPVLGTLDAACATVLDAAADALLVDVAGPSPLVLGAELVSELAQGRRLVKLADGGYGWLSTDPAP